MTQSTRLYLRITPELKQALESLAEQDRRQLSDYVRIILEDHVQETTMTTDTTTAYRTHLIQPTNDGHYQTLLSNGEPTDLSEWIWEMRAGAEAYILGKDDLPEEVEDIRGLIHNQPDIVIAIVEHDPVGDAVTYWGANKIETAIDYLYK